MARYTLEVPLSGRLEERDDGTWVAYNNEFGFIVYGASQEEAVVRARDAFGDVTDALMQGGGIEALKKWLDRHGIRHLLVEDANEVRVHRYDCIERRELAGV